MQLRLHANATTTPKERGYIQASSLPVAMLAEELGVSETTIRRWKTRTTVHDGSHNPQRLAISLTTVEEELVCELRTRLQLSLDDITEVMRRCVNQKLSRSAIHRCLRRHGIAKRPPPQKLAVGVFETAPIGFIHIDLKYLPPLERKKSYAFVAIDRATRYVYVEIHPHRDAETAAAFLEAFLAHFPHPVHTILTDNGSEFTDRFAERQAAGSPLRQPSFRPTLRTTRYLSPTYPAFPSADQRNGRTLQPPHRRGYRSRTQTWSRQTHLPITHRSRRFPLSLRQ